MSDQTGQRWSRALGGGLQPAEEVVDKGTTAGCCGNPNCPVGDWGPRAERNAGGEGEREGFIFDMCG